MKLIGTENLERQFTISISESDLGTLFLALGKCSDMDIREHRDECYSGLKYNPDALVVYQEIRNILES